MPNWCENRILIEGPSETLMTLRVRLLSGSPLQRTSSKYSPEVDLADVEFENTVAGGISFFVATRWKPPVDWVETLQRQFPDLHIEMGYCEMGDGFYGVWKDGIDSLRRFEKGDLIIDENVDHYSVDEHTGGALRLHLNKYLIGLGG